MQKLPTLEGVKSKITQEYREEFLRFLEVIRNQIRISDLEQIGLSFASKARPKIDRSEDKPN